MKAGYRDLSTNLGFRGRIQSFLHCSGTGGIDASGISRSESVLAVVIKMMKLTTRKDEGTGNCCEYARTVFSNYVAVHRIGAGNKLEECIIVVS